MLLSSTEIRLQYRARDGKTGAIQIDPREFFEADSGETASIRELVWRSNHATDYLGMPPDLVDETALDVYCSATRERIRDVERFWNDGRNRTVLRRETVDGREIYWLRIVEVHTDEGIHFLRFGSESTSESGLLEHHLVTASEEVRFLFP